MRGEIGREGFASGMQGTGIREQGTGKGGAGGVREANGYTFPPASKLAGNPVRDETAWMGHSACSYWPSSNTLCFSIVSPFLGA